MKSLIVYYSYEGNCEEITKAIKEVADADVLCIEPKKENKTKSLYSAGLELMLHQLILLFQKMKLKVKT